MKFMANTCFFLAIFGFSLAINWEPDNDLQGTILQPSRKVHLLDVTKSFIFKFDIRVLKFFEYNKQKILRDCPNDTIEIELFNSALKELNSDWMQNTHYKLKDGVELVQKPTVLKELQRLQDTFSSDCSSLKEIHSLILEVNNKLNLAARLNIVALDYFIGINNIQREARWMVEYHGNKYAVPFNHHLFTSEFWKHVELNFLYKDNYIFIEVEIPFYTKKKLDLFVVRPKPLIWANQPYLYNISRQYAIVDTSQPILYSEEELNSYCKLMLDTTFCKWDANLQKTCYDVVFALNNKIYDSDCFTPMKRCNMITQIGKNIYFTIFTPLQVWVERFNFKYFTTLPSSMKIIPPIESNISTTFFHLNESRDDAYEIFFETQPAFNNFFTHINGKDQLKFFSLLTISLFLVVLIVLSKEIGQQFLLYIVLKDELLENAIKEKRYQQKTSAV